MSEVAETARPEWKQQVKAAISFLAEHDQVEMPTKHHFSPGLYIREIFMPADTFVIGKIHKTEHPNIISKGRVLLVDEHGTKELVAPCTFTSKAGVQKALYIVEDTVWSTVHITNERDLDKLEAQLIEPDDYPLFDRTSERLAIESAAKSEAASSSRLLTEEST